MGMFSILPDKFTTCGLEFDRVADIRFNAKCVNDREYNVTVIVGTSEVVAFDANSRDTIIESIDSSLVDDAINRGYSVSPEMVKKEVRDEIMSRIEDAVGRVVNGVF